MKMSEIEVDFSSAGLKKVAIKKKAGPTPPPFAWEKPVKEKPGTIFVCPVCGARNKVTDFDNPETGWKTRCCTQRAVLVLEDSLILQNNKVIFAKAV